MTRTVRCPWCKGRFFIVKGSIIVKCRPCNGEGWLTVTFARTT